MASVVEVRKDEPDRTVLAKACAQIRADLPPDPAAEAVLPKFAAAVRAVLARL